MFIELLDVLRCIRPHEDSWLVGSFDALEDRHVIRGTLGCPVCSAEYPIRNGVVDFTERGASPGPASADRAGGEAASTESALRLAAMLGLAEAGGIAMLSGGRAGVLAEIEAVAPGVQLLVVNPVASLPRFASAVTTGRVLPVAAASVRAIALDAATGADLPQSEAVRVLKPGGRLVAPATVPVPGGVTELARDERDWVAERNAVETTGPVLRLTRRAP